MNGVSYVSLHAPHFGCVVELLYLAAFVYLSSPIVCNLLPLNVCVKIYYRYTLKKLAST